MVSLPKFILGGSPSGKDSLLSGTSSIYTEFKEQKPESTSLKLSWTYSIGKLSGIIINVLSHL